MNKIALAALLAVACGSAAAEDVLHIYNWNNALSPDTAKRFEQSCKCKLVQDYYGDNEEMLAKLAAGAKGYDMVFPTAFAVNTLLKQGRLQPLDKSRLPNWKNLNSGYLALNQPFDPGNRYAAPTVVSLTLIGYNATQLKKAGVEGKSNSWALVFDPALLAKIKGKVTVLDSQRELMAAALMYLGKDANSTNPADWKAAAETIRKAKPYWAAFNNQSYIKELTVGNIWVALGYSNDLFQAQQDAKNAKRPFELAYRPQQEGNVLAIDNMTILKDAPRPDLAHKFINFMLDGKNASEISNQIGATNPVKAAEAFFKPQIKANPVIMLDPSKGKYVALKDLDVKSRRELNRLWSQVKIGR
ncbi:Spermidine/putrescine-binding periplasmic protein [Chromobacterium violaceum]|uniref:ABC transporter substrate-binding protein n=1 Tax=Chromobacterium violaceum TaxID=536 RepID=UPI0005B8CBD0|nr:spermidine/putrescine ABC transporter substrate-binding protein [Chromobacterium violaceum]MBP4047024.1 spermidine/putrescine ABC transporter substrate-binding protein [Chromobacterium violaceum]OQS25805.1 spermidine/putrescine ABC transporter substrate-binding protein [Chromobacterium violaceum]OQS50455.1 spermidine/putrescine ABC transporter substrate-binding protein [Chromobacterium violaceum]OQS52640.1 spermidine/putrescine ABC transporter substrate-binding protein [Chromobacterium viola